ncbi:hypothetical protein A3K02_02460 [candidate division WS6 bacterium RIFOXYD1_FULL_33_8]|uniref:Uncharacterized protein n=2 Tax=Candidatus Dojkabacteria TaxID=74243 RepID=A0A0G0CVE3_9BACT|nr:MAG: hypothetical protein UR32_C0013G0008 [candidate division WS6 bacterium GW2011_GWE2_33_157]KKP43792.1 MAG: hypothetical protein UR34_C0011G0046 [candidate division WS6 bacterium GW2011_GWC1_33_20]KKP44841.1 MAG: hypothetical protein UR36_C0013G0009 [candidate division WS6 bacterium GW2011_GWF1_33_233]KKP54436.1 MAG: hypothetical protein UR45_C0015G0008 [candidate division WS6 bacterium GW2011_WS6_33_547]KKP55015.1 MAG: hypothetical protein UR47_C0006G0008 [candidate division WS6 bacteriu
MKKYILNKHIRYRKEDGYILVCDCKRLLDYEMPLEYFDLLELFKNGYMYEETNKEVMKELFELRIIEEKGKERGDVREDIFSKLGYDENEFV